MGLKVVRVTLSLDPIILETIDEERGLAKRSTFVNDLLRKQLAPILKKQQKETTVEKP
jgi:metal-responsive CopG/Arc/MetJ family transcriptional regulator